MAGRKCTICEHPERKEIDKECTREGAILRTIAHHFELSESSLKRHVSKGHIIAKIAKAVKAQEIVEADDLLKEIREIEETTKEIIKSATTGTDQKPYLALKAIDTRHKQIELKGKVLGSFKGDKPNGPIRIIKAEDLSDDELASIATGRSE
ncbi:MAG: hypothetical protein M0Q91_15665 [Methanoregula sp.]|jgi:hypothetical protein|nr:hypothetical protein [Methanoregula sp.]